MSSRYYYEENKNNRYLHAIIKSCTRADRLKYFTKYDNIFFDHNIIRNPISPDELVEKILKKNKDLYNRVLVAGRTNLSLPLFRILLEDGRYSIYEALSRNKTLSQLTEEHINFLDKIYHKNRLIFNAIKNEIFSSELSLSLFRDLDTNHKSYLISRTDLIPNIEVKNYISSVNSRYLSDFIINSLVDRGETFALSDISQSFPHLFYPFLRKEDLKLAINNITKLTGKKFINSIKYILHNPYLKSEDFAEIKKIIGESKLNKLTKEKLNTIYDNNYCLIDNSDRFEVTSNNLTNLEVPWKFTSKSAQLHEFNPKTEKPELGFFLSAKTEHFEKVYLYLEDNLNSEQAWDTFIALLPAWDSNLEALVLVSNNL